LLIINDKIRTHIQTGMSADELSHLAMKEGMTSIAENAIVQARLKHTSIAEIYRACM
jgi:type II secretory ATPase GspE/PulE/Tfp pilus assembly ATPase PilB-like protein